MKIHGRIYIILAILFGVIGVVQCVRWHASGGAATIGYLLNFLPAVALLIAYIVRRKTKQEHHRNTASMLCIIAFSIWGFVTLCAESIIYSTAEVTNIKRYEDVLENRWGYNSGISHFPRPIPVDAQNMRFSFFPGFLQGGGKIELCYSTSPETISELYDRFSKKTTKSSESDEAREYEEMMDGMRYNYFYTNLFDDSIFPEDFEVMVFEKKGNLYSEIRQGVAISKKRNEIVYWAQVIK